MPMTVANHHWPRKRLRERNKAACNRRLRILISRIVDLNDSNATAYDTMRCISVKILQSVRMRSKEQSLSIW